MKVRAWDKVCNCYVEDNWKVYLNGSTSTEEGGWCTGEFEFEHYVGLKDKNDKEGWEGDLRRYHGKIYKVVNDIWRFRLERNLFEFGENEDITIDEDVMWESEYIGTIHDKVVDRRTR